MLRSKTSKYTKMCGHGFKPIAPQEIKEAVKEEKKAEQVEKKTSKEDQKKLFAAWTRF